MFISRANEKVLAGVGRLVLNCAAMSSMGKASGKEKSIKRKASDSHVTSKFLETGTKTAACNMERKLWKTTKNVSYLWLFYKWYHTD